VRKPPQRSNLGKLLGRFPWRRSFWYWPKEKATAAYESGVVRKMQRLRGTAWHQMQVLARFLGSSSLAALLVHGAAFSPYFRKLARFAKLATS
jgi:hypothetical protein